MEKITRLGVCESCERWSWASIGDLCRFCGVATVTAHFADQELEELDFDLLLGSRPSLVDED